MSNHPDQALRSADLLSTAAPDAGHFNHMPGHIYALCGDYEKARIVSERSIRADDMYADYAGSLNFYVTARGHDLHLMMFACMLLGQYAPALWAAVAQAGPPARLVGGVVLVVASCRRPAAPGSGAGRVPDLGQVPQLAPGIMTRAWNR